jgi:hypothetical protein
VYPVVKRVSGIAVGLVLGVAMILAMEFPEASASESSVSTAEVTSPIELGPSQKARCKRTAPNDQVPYEKCISAARVLALMSAEPRNKAWADKMESDLSEWIESLASKGFTSRNVECRLSWCIVEVGSTQGHLLEMSLRDQQKRKLFDRLDLFAPDVDDPNADDIVIIFKRYCKSTREIFDGDGHLVPDFDTVGQKC